jgi:hypothetical protein
VKASRERVVARNERPSTLVFASHPCILCPSARAYRNRVPDERERRQPRRPPARRRRGRGRRGAGEESRGFLLCLTPFSRSEVEALADEVVRHLLDGIAAGSSSLPALKRMAEGGDPFPYGEVPRRVNGGDEFAAVVHCLRPRPCQAPSHGQGGPQKRSRRSRGSSCGPETTLMRLASRRNRGSSGRLPGAQCARRTPSPTRTGPPRRARSRPPSAPPRPRPRHAGRGGRARGRRGSGSVWPHRQARPQKRPSRAPGAPRRPVGRGPRRAPGRPQEATGPARTEGSAPASAKRASRK